MIPTMKFICEKAGKMGKTSKTQPDPQDPKRHSSERYRGQRLVVERWTNAKAALVAYWTAKGHTSVRIAEMLGDGTRPETIRRMWRLWVLPLDSTGGRHRATVPVPLFTHERVALATHAKKIGLEPEEYLRRISICVISDNLYSAVTDGRFDDD